MTDEPQQVLGAFPAFSGADPDLLAELGRATTAYHEALPEQLELAREEYERVLIKFKSRYSRWTEPDRR